MPGVGKKTAREWPLKGPFKPIFYIPFFQEKTQKGHWKPNTIGDPKNNKIGLPKSPFAKKNSYVICVSHCGSCKIVLLQEKLKKKKLKIGVR